MSFGISDKSFELIINVLKQTANIKESIIFGSRALGNYKPGSDIDLAIKLDEDTDNPILETIFNQNLPIPYKVDVVYYNKQISPELKQHIDEKGISIYKRP